ncbi:SapC family protein [Thalassotalea atypica]|uniref:SapC family protein n=1 Tax=Thalassotalea atypica TaxID=2054316 RepID=UPI002572457F|nr:SapC family protein [Thalassotalea atypica]
MTQLVAVNNQAHRQLFIDTGKVELHGAELHLVPVVMSEFQHLCVECPIVLTKNDVTGQFVFAAMLGFEVNENLFWQQGRWQGLYLPLQIQRQPFFVGNPEKTAAEKNSSSDSKDYVVCIDNESPCISSASSEQQERIYDEHGNETPYFEQIKGCLAQLLQGEINNEGLISELQQLDLIQPLALDITFVNEQSTRLNGLYTIDQEKLAKLNAEVIGQLHEKKLLQPIYTVIASLAQIYALIERKNKQLSDGRA